MIKKIDRTRCIELYSQLAHLEENNILEGNNFFYPKAFASFALSYRAESFLKHATVMADEFTQMVKEFGYDACLFFPNEDKAWIQDPGDKEILMDAIDFLFEHNVDSEFNGGLHVSVPILPNFLKHILILSHYCEAFPSINFTDDTQNFLSSICTHGNIHVDILNEDCIHLAFDAVEKSKLTIIENEMCHSVYRDTQTQKKISTYLSV